MKTLKRKPKPGKVRAHGWVCRLTKRYWCVRQCALDIRRMDCRRVEIREVRT